MVKNNQIKTKGRALLEVEKKFIVVWFTNNFIETKVSHSQYLKALQNDMIKQGFNLVTINNEKLKDYMRSRIRAHRKGGPAYGEESTRKKLSPLKGLSIWKIRFLKKAR